MSKKGKGRKKSKSKRDRKGSLRQLRYPREFRIGPPREAADVSSGQDAQTASPRRPTSGAEPTPDWQVASRIIAELGSLAWYLKTKHFKCAWADEEASDEDPRARRALGRLHRCVEELKRFGVEIQDPTKKRYPPGGEGLMKPLQFLPTAGLMYDVVHETITPIIYRDGVLIQRGEVLVAVPVEPVPGTGAPSIDQSPPVAPETPTPTAPPDHGHTA